MSLKYKTLTLGWFSIPMDEQWQQKVGEFAIPEKRMCLDFSDEYAYCGCHLASGMTYMHSNMPWLTLTAQKPFCQGGS